MVELAKKSCVPCHSGGAPMTRAEAESMLAHVPGWRLEDEATRIERRYRFGDFAAALDFVDAIGAVAEAEGHHPDISFGWGYATVSLQTHAIKGLHENDFVLAAKVEEAARARAAG